MMALKCQETQILCGLNIIGLIMRLFRVAKSRYHTRYCPPCKIVAMPCDEGDNFTAKVSVCAPRGDALYRKSWLQIAFFRQEGCLRDWI